MQVKISYTVDMADVPKEVSSILSGLTAESEQLVRLVGESTHCLRSNDLGVAKLHISFLKEILQRMFSRLTDCQTILEGYEKALNPQQESKE